ncbi:MAG TPA: LysR family transcriptional regulator [Clostridiales bacterium]|jgi:DNA-binding transcriptional LysR family regulator|nr:LysR family transcriptional regulator [Clostridiales bacterium]
MNSKLLRYVVSIAEERSISKAADKLYISQPSLSQRIISLEEELGIELFDRGSIPLTVTAAGELYVEAAKKILKIEEDLQDELQQMKFSDSKNVRVGISLFRNSLVLPKVIPIVTTIHPGAHIEIIESTNKPLAKMISQGEIDLAFLTDKVDDNLTYIKVYTDRVLLALGKDHKLSQNYTITDDYPKIDLEKLAFDQFTLLDPSSNLRTITHQIFEDHNHFQPKTVIETASVEFANRMAASNASAAIVIESVKELYSSEQSPNYFRFMKKDYTFDVYICFKKNISLSKFIMDFANISIHSFMGK